MLILYVTLIGAAVGVRDAGHLGMESLLVLVSAEWRRRLGFVIHLLVGTFGALMAPDGAVLGESVAVVQAPQHRPAGGWHYVPLVISGVLIVLFSVEHAIALVRRTEVDRAWH